MFKDAPVQFNYYSMVEARALVTNYYQPTRARRLWRHYLSSLTGGAGSLLLTVVFYPLFSRRMDTRCRDQRHVLNTAVASQQPGTVTCLRRADVSCTILAILLRGPTIFPSSVTELSKY